MAQVEWPTRHVQCSTLNLGASDYFTMSADNRHVVAIGTQVTYVSGNTRATRYVQLRDNTANPAHQYSISSDEAGTTIVGVTGRFTLEVPAATITNYPTPPRLVDPGAQTHSTATNPLDVKTWTQGFAVFEGSVMIESLHRQDVPIVEAFVDQLYDPNAWFELPLPGEHLGSNNITAYDAASGEITIDVSSAGNPSLQDRYVHGRFCRIGARTGRIVSSRQTGTDLIVKVVPPGLINGTTSQAQSNSFASAATCRVRAVDVTVTGSSDFGSTWSIDWIETTRRD